MTHLQTVQPRALRIQAVDGARLHELPQAQAPIGLFDSGLGGITVLKALLKRLPHERFWFVADQHHVPYGDRSLEQIAVLAESLGHTLLQEGCKLVTPACNVSCATALEQGRLPADRCIGVIEPAVELATQATGQQQLGLIATAATVKSGAYGRALSRHAPGLELLAVAAPTWVPLVEAGQLNGPATEAAVRQITEAFDGSAVDTVILGCTHYPWLLPVLNEVAPHLEFIDPAEATAEAVAQWLAASELHNPNPQAEVPVCFTTGDAAVFERQLELHNLDADILEGQWTFDP